MSVYIQCLKMSSLDHPWNNKALLLTGIEVYGLRFSVNKPVQLKNTKTIEVGKFHFCSLSSFKKIFLKISKFQETCIKRSCSAHAGVSLHHYDNHASGK